MSAALTLEVLPELLAIAQLAPTDPIPEWALSGPFFSFSKTSDELSIVCRQSDVPTTVKSEREWLALKVKGPLDFALTGILSSIARPLANAGVSIFALSTFDTDYVLVRQGRLEDACSALEKEGHVVLRGSTSQP